MSRVMDAAGPVPGLSLDRASAVPPSAQLARGIRDSVRAGTLSAGSRLPTVRALAEQLGLAANTVAKVYRELEADGVIETRGRAGTFVAASDPTEAAALEAASQFAARIHELGITAADALALAERALTSTD